MILKAGTQYCITVLEKAHDKISFSCGNEALDTYLKKQASQEIKKNISVTYVITEENCRKILGYYSIASNSFDADGLPIELLKKLPKYPRLPAIIIGRLAVHQHHKKAGLGTHLVVHALQKSLAISQQIGATAVIVDAKDTQAIQFYKKLGFCAFEDNQHKLFIPIDTVKKLGL